MIHWHLKFISETGTPSIISNVLSIPLSTLINFIPGKESSIKLANSLEEYSLLNPRKEELHNYLLQLLTILLACATVKFIFLGLSTIFIIGKTFTISGSTKFTAIEAILKPFRMF